MADIVTLQDNEGKDLYPNTKTEAVIDSNGNRLDRVLKGALYTGATPTGEVKAVPIDAGTLNGHSDSYFATKKSVDDLNASLSSNKYYAVNRITDTTTSDSAGYIQKSGNTCELTFVAISSKVQTYANQHIGQISDSSLYPKEQITIHSFFTDSDMQTVPCIVIINTSGNILAYYAGNVLNKVIRLYLTYII